MMTEITVTFSEEEARAVLTAVKSNKELMGSDARHDRERTVLEVVSLKISTSLQAVPAYEGGYGKF